MLSTSYAAEDSKNNNKTFRISIFFTTLGITNRCLRGTKAAQGTNASRPLLRTYFPLVTIWTKPSCHDRPSANLADFEIAQRGRLNVKLRVAWGVWSSLWTPWEGALCHRAAGSQNTLCPTELTWKAICHGMARL